VLVDLVVLRPFQQTAIWHDVKTEKRTFFSVGSPNGTNFVNARPSRADRTESLVSDPRDAESPEICPTESCLTAPPSSAANNHNVQDRIDTVTRVFRRKIRNEALAPSIEPKA